MQANFITYLEGNKEVLLNLNLLWKIEVSYGVPDPNKPGWTSSTTLKEGLTDPATVKRYTLYFGSESFMFFANPDDPVMKAIEEIYRAAIKSSSPKKE